MATISLFCEDVAQERTVKAIVKRLQEQFVGLPSFEYSRRTSVRGGDTMFGELRTYIRLVEANRLSKPDLLIVSKDGNGVGYQGTKRRLEKEIGPGNLSWTVFAIPEPHVERWLLWDQGAFRKVFGAPFELPKSNSKTSDYYKNYLATAIANAGIETIFGGAEFAEELLENSDLDLIQSFDKSFKFFHDSLVEKFAQFVQEKDHR
ncbi:hypothetical protein EBR96_03810 [bacterium]|nr:hypothetical protein [bacterium]